MIGIHMIKNKAINEHIFLEDMYKDQYYPRYLVDKLKQILLNVCIGIEQNNPKNLEQLYALTHQATEEINDLQQAFDDADSEIETVARESLGADFHFIAQAYDFKDADIEELISPRDW